MTEPEWRLFENAIGFPCGRPVVTEFDGLQVQRRASDQEPGAQGKGHLMRLRRQGLRLATRFELLCSAGRQEGTGVLADISHSGARISETPLRPAMGTAIRLYVFVQPVSPVEVVGEVTRHTEDGFAIEYKTSDPALVRLLDDLAAIVGVARKRS